MGVSAMALLVALFGVLPCEAAVRARRKAVDYEEYEELTPFGPHFDHAQFEAYPPDDEPPRYHGYRKATDFGGFGRRR
ncbi:unnamed protein product [Darwinula stevensoni]|uniref:Uncharacterized protein n=1 Tax=Darwinula stevensoni TaxID=69355 RepID=A0A7R9FQI2_9CRUS|nr:unnamed protein product [Darwinula stevensoni]CAG0899553.1 unnamed protein product [Darwinula stevensoni]